MAPHEDLLRLFYRNFVSGDGDDGSMEDEYRAHWAERPSECDALVRHLTGVDVRGTVERATHRVRFLHTAGVELATVLRLPAAVIADEVGA